MAESTDKTPIFSKARVSNIMAAATVATVLYGFIAGVPDTIAEGSFMGILAGFAAKHLFDTAQS
jgi:hypothetical protein